MIGERLSHFEIIDKLGSGGMGEVYRARDTKLKRDVAIKVLPAALAGDEERMARFEREAQALAALNHPNIGSIYGLEHADSTFALILELVEGRTLAERIERGAVPIEEAVAIAKQIAEGLEAAHAKGIIHRDLKPANVMITEDGTVKLLDFGLAKALEGDTSESIDDSNSPTLSRAATQAGVLLGTAGYMSPEQARGKPVDKRTDIWALGVVLFEILTGKRLFDGETVSDTLAAVLKTEPNWQELPLNTPWLLKRLLTRCLEKDRAERLHDAADVRIELRDASMETHEAPRKSTRSPAMAVVAGVALLLGLTIGSAVMSRVANVVPEQPIRFSLDVPEIQIGARQVALSPDGYGLAFATRELGTVFYRTLGELDGDLPSPLSRGVQPFFSPDGRWIGFRDGPTLKKVASTGGETVSICECAGRSHVWSEDNTIFFTSAAGLLRVSANGGEPELVIPTDDESTFEDFRLLPGARAILTAEVLDGSSWIVFLSLTTGKRTRLVQGHTPHYLESGYLIFARGGDLLEDTTLFATRFDGETPELHGDTIPIAVGVVTRGGMTGSPVAQSAISRTGTLVYAGRAKTDANLVWLRRDGTTTQISDDAADYAHPTISPDGSRLAYTMRDAGTLGRGGLWVYDLTRGTRTLVQEGRPLDPVWTPDGDALTFTLPTVSEGFGLYSKAADGSGEPVLLVGGGDGAVVEPSWSSDGRLLVYQSRGSFRALTDDGEQQLLEIQGRRITGPRISPNGKWLAYGSNVSGQDEIYVAPTDKEQKLVTISTNGGHSPVWSRDGSELFYIEGERLMVVAVETDEGFRAGTPRALFRGSFVTSNDISYDVHPDGERFIAIQSESPYVSNTLHFIIHFDEELRQRLP